MNNNNLNIEDIKDLGWEHHRHESHMFSTTDIFVIRDYRTHGQTLYELIELTVMSRKDGNFNVMIFHESIDSEENERHLIDESTSCWADVVISKMWQLEYLMEWTEVNSFIN